MISVNSGIKSGFDIVSVALTMHSLDSAAGLQLFQSGKIPESEQEWDRFVPHQALEALGKKEVERQSVLFEVFKSELGYVNDLQTIEDVRCINHLYHYD